MRIMKPINVRNAIKSVKIAKGLKMMIVYSV